MYGCNTYLRTLKFIRDSEGKGQARSISRLIIIDHSKIVVLYLYMFPFAEQTQSGGGTSAEHPTRRR